MQEINVQVAVRVRPQLDREKLKQDGVCVIAKSLTNEVLLGKDRCFVFDNVFPVESSQIEIYENSVKPLVKSCFEGYNATVFAYGQTGSGKTFTMGSQTSINCSSESLGVIPRSISEIFEIAESLKDRRCTLRVSFLEVYKDELIDLLDEEHKDISIREDPLGNTFIVGCSQVVCKDLEEVMELLWKGSLHKRTGATRMNDQSSRSHTIFTLYIEQVHIVMNFDGIENDTDYTCAKFHFVDLAGSERANRTGNVGERFIESIHINTGLLALGNVISALGDQKKKVHIPYRDSKITRILKDSLGGNARTLMICCVSPSVPDYDETLNSLKYAQRARNIKNKPVINHNPCVLQVENLKTEIETLKEALRQEKAKTISCDTSEVNKQLQEELSRLKHDCSKYYNMANEAFKHIKTIQDKALLSQSLNGHLNQWIEVMQDLKHWNNLQIQDCCIGESILKLQSELKNKERELELRDKTIAKQSIEIAELTDHIKKLQNGNICLNLKSCNDDLDNDLRKQNEVFTGDSNIITGINESGHIQTRERAKSVPSYLIGARRLQGMITDRNIHTSPGCLTVQKIGNVLKLGTDYMHSELEDTDNVSTFRESHGDHFQKEDILLKRKKTFKLRNVEHLQNQIHISNMLGTNNEEFIKDKQEINQTKLHEERIRCLENENFLLRQEIIHYKNELEKTEVKRLDEAKSNIQQFKCSIDTNNNHSRTLAQRQEDKLITAKLRSITTEEMRDVTTASSNWINEQIKAHLEDKILHESLQEDIVARNKLTHEKELFENLKSELQHKLKTRMNVANDVATNKKEMDEEMQEDFGNSTDLQLLNECDETLEAIEETIKFRNDTIACKQEDLHKSKSNLKNESFFYRKINLFSQEEIKFLLFKFFKKVVETKHEKRKLSIKNEHLKISINEKNILIKELELQLRCLDSDHEKKIARQHLDFEERLRNAHRNFLDVERILKEKICEMAKEVLYYKSTYRELKNKAKLKPIECQDLSISCQEIQSQKSVGKKPNRNLSEVRSSKNLAQNKSQLNNSKDANKESKEILNDSLEDP